MVNEFTNLSTLGGSNSSKSHYERRAQFNGDTSQTSTVQRTKLCRSELPANDVMPDPSFSPACQFYAITTP
ncbi:hypothetical protein EVAR_77454_1 [Eumeta japonica]|uniref:Uncharacterized protein n=1 Tax=Eumeta variegata TaxID=151549 RepID=A0A4C1YV20_EUMVA|nr:hypothetical protein EVAR_77454_1 [Eumeta japonica]